jgi:hypothetical protein
MIPVPGGMVSGTRKLRSDDLSTDLVKKWDLKIETSKLEC